MLAAGLNPVSLSMKPETPSEPLPARRPNCSRELTLFASTLIGSPVLGSTLPGMFFLSPPVTVVRRSIKSAKRPISDCLVITESPVARARSIAD